MCSMETDPLNVVIDSCGNYVYAPGQVIALVGVKNLVVVQTKDALLITTRERSQDVGKVVAELKTAGREDLYLATNFRERSTDYGRDEDGGEVWNRRMARDYRG